MGPNDEHWVKIEFKLILVDPDEVDEEELGDGDIETEEYVDIPLVIPESFNNSISCVSSLVAA